MSDSVKQQVIRDMEMAGLSASTRRTYLDIIVRFVKRTRIRPQDATEEQVAEYLRGLIQRGYSRGTIAPLYSALRFIFENTLARQWGLFKKRGLPARVESVCRGLLAMARSAASSPPSATRCIGPV
jgi:site-specific recombinase XerD